MTLSALAPERQLEFGSTNYTIWAWRQREQTRTMTSQGSVRIPWRADFAVGWGLSGFSGAPAPKPWAFEDSARVQLNQLPDRSEVVPGNISFQQGVVSSTDDYKPAIDAAGSLSIKSWGVASGKTSADFSQQSRNQQQSCALCRGFQL